MHLPIINKKRSTRMIKFMGVLRFFFFFSSFNFEVAFARRMPIDHVKPSRDSRRMIITKWSSYVVLMFIRHPIRPFFYFILPCVGEKKKQLRKSQFLHHSSRLVAENLGFGLTKFRCCRSRFDMASHLLSAFALSCSFESVGQGTKALLYLAQQVPFSTMAFFPT